jgi:hypothetical protein
MQAESRQFEEYPVTDLDIGWPQGNTSGYTLVDGRDTLSVEDSSLSLYFGIGADRTTEEWGWINLTQVCWYRLHKRLHRREVKVGPEASTGGFAGPRPAAS